MDNNTFIRIQNLRKTYRMGTSQVHALAGVNLEVERNTLSVIMGPSGSGKSTLLYLLGGLDRPTSGQALVDGQSLDAMDENDLAHYRQLKVGFIFQSFNLISSLNAMENVAFPMRFMGIRGKERKKRAMALLAQVGLENRWNHKPTELSGGQQQRVAIARALVADPALILADEPTGNLDSTSGLSIMQLLSDLHKSGRTIVVVTHDPRMAHFSTHMIYLLDGRVVDEAEYTAATAALVSEITPS